MRKDWEVKKLGDVCYSLNGLWTGKNPPFVSVSVIRNTNFSKDCKLVLNDVAIIEVERNQYLSRKLIYGDIIIEKSGGSDKQPVGRPVIFKVKEGEYSFSNFTSTLRVVDKDIVYPDFLYYQLKFYYFDGRTLKMQTKTTGLRNLQLNAYLNQRILLPPLQTQQQIVEELDCLTSIIEKQKKQLEELDNLAQSIFYDMFGDPIENEKGWSKTYLGKEFKISSGGTPDTKNHNYWDNGNISWIGSNLCQNSILYCNDGKFITEEGLLNSSAKLYNSGYVLVALVGATIGKVAMLKFSTTTNQNIAGIDVNSNKQYTSEFIFYLLQALYPLFLQLGGDKFKMANLSFIRALPLITPPLSLQQKFASKIEAIEKQKELIKKSIKETEDLFNSRMDYYFN